LQVPGHFYFSCIYAGFEVYSQVFRILGQANKSANQFVEESNMYDYEAADHPDRCGLCQTDRSFCAFSFNLCEISEQNSTRMTLFRGNMQRQTTNTVRCSLLVFVVPHDFTRNTEIQCVLLQSEYRERFTRFTGAAPDGEHDDERR